MDTPPKTIMAGQPGPPPVHEPPPEIKVSFSALRETNAFRKPLIRPAISRGGTSRGGWLTSHKTNIYISKKEPFQKDPRDPDPKKSSIFQVLNLLEHGHSLCVCRKAMVYMV